MCDSEKRVSLALYIRIYTQIYTQHNVSCCCFGLLPWCAWPNPFLPFFFFLFSIAFCKDSWEDFTDLVEQMQMLDEFKGAYGGITLPSPPHPRLGHHPKTTAGAAARPCLYWTSLPEQHIRTTASKALPSPCSFVVFFICLFFSVLSPFLFFFFFWFDVSVNSFVSVTFASYLL